MNALVAFWPMIGTHLPQSQRWRVQRLTTRRMIHYKLGQRGFFSANQKTRPRVAEGRDTMSLNSFLEMFGISTVDFNASGCEWSELQRIKEHHEERIPQLNRLGQLVQQELQSVGPNILHSVRMRVKNPDHLLEKIVRKRKEVPSRNISIETYQRELTDLVGVRVLLLYKERWLPMHTHLERILKVSQKTAYIRQGDESPLTQAYASAGFDVQEHPIGYRSLHYNFEATPFKETVVGEVQMRTIAEELWSEIDHESRYPYRITQNQLVNEMLRILNFYTGTADQMGSFIKKLESSVDATMKSHKLELATRDEEIANLVEKVKEALQTTAHEKAKNADLLKQVTLLPSYLKPLEQSLYVSLSGLPLHATNSFNMNTLPVSINFDKMLEEGIAPLKGTLDLISSSTQLISETLKKK